MGKYVSGRVPVSLLIIISSFIMWVMIESCLSSHDIPRGICSLMTSPTITHATIPTIAHSTTHNNHPLPTYCVSSSMKQYAPHFSPSSPSFPRKRRVPSVVSIGRPRNERPSRKGSFQGSIPVVVMLVANSDRSLAWKCPVCDSTNAELLNADSTTLPSPASPGVDLAMFQFSYAKERLSSESSSSNTTEGAPPSGTEEGKVPQPSELTSNGQSSTLRQRAVPPPPIDTAPTQPDPATTSTSSSSSAPASASSSTAVARGQAQPQTAQSTTAPSIPRTPTHRHDPRMDMLLICILFVLCILLLRRLLIFLAPAYSYLM